jgi:hypothetical protein
LFVSDRHRLNASFFDNFKDLEAKDSEQQQEKSGKWILEQ